MRKFDINDVLIIAGAIGIIAGVWLIFFPAALILTGILLLYLGLAGSLKEKVK